MCSICRHTKEVSHYIAYHLIECQFYLHVYINRYFIHFKSFAYCLFWGLIKKYLLNLANSSWYHVNFKTGKLVHSSNSIYITPHFFIVSKVIFSKFTAKNTLKVSYAWLKQHQTLNKVYCHLFHNLFFCIIIYTSITQWEFSVELI